MKASIHPTATIHDSVQIGADVYIGPHVAIQAGVKIGNGVYIHPHVAIYSQVQIGDRTVLHSNCVIHERTRIGSDCVIHSGAVLGAEGFGFVPIPEGWFKIEQSGYIVLADGVEVGRNSTIDRPSVGKTQVGSYSKLADLVHIAHGCQIGQNCTISAQVGIAGSSDIGDRVTLGNQVGISDHVKLGDDVVATAKAGIHSDIESGAIFSGYPAIPHKLFIKAAAVYKRLPEVYRILKQLQQRAGSRE